MKKIIFASLIISFVLVLTGCKYLNNGNNNNNLPQDSQRQGGDAVTNEADYVINPDDVVLFWGKGCPHCENIDKFLAENAGLTEKLNLKKIEVFEDLKGQKVFMEKVKECQLDQAGVPLFYKDKKCLQGDTPVIEELKKSLQTTNS